jgi:hypothetical protein
MQDYPQCALLGVCGALNCVFRGERPAFGSLGPQGRVGFGIVGRVGRDFGF